MGHAFKAEARWIKALALTQKMFGRDHVRNFLYINHLAMLYERAGRWEHATAMYRRVLAGRIKLLGDEHKDSLMSAYELGTPSTQLNDYGTARELFEKVLPGFERT